MPDKIHELDVVALTTDLPEENLVRGQMGTVVMELAPDACEAEFSDRNGRTYALLAIPTQKLRVLHSTPPEPHDAKTK